MGKGFPRRLRGWRFFLLNISFGLGHLLVLFGAASYVALLPHAAGDLGGVLPSFGGWAQTDFMIGLALAFPVARWLAYQYGDYRVYIVAFIGFAGASLLCAISQTLWLFLPARILLGISGGITLPLGQALWLKEYPERLKTVGLGIWGVFTIIPFTLGMPIGGWLADELGWRSLFYLNIPLALTIAGLTGALLYHRGFFRRAVRFDVGGFLLLALVLGGIQTLLNMGNDFDWFDSFFLRGVFMVVVVSGVCLVVWVLGTPNSAVDLRLFTHRNFAIGILCLTVGFLSIQGLLTLLILQLQILMGYSSFLAGMVFVPMLLLGIPVIAAMHMLCQRVDARWLACLNFLGFAGIFYWVALFDDPHSYDQIFWPMMLEGLFLGSFFTPLIVLTLHGMSGRRLERAAELSTWLRITAGAVGITLFEIVVFRRTPHHQLHLADHFGGREFVWFDGIAQVSNRLTAMGWDQTMVKGQLAAMINQSAGILAMNDAFYQGSFLFLCLAALVWLAHPTHLSSISDSSERFREMLAEEMAEDMP